MERKVPVTEKMFGHFLFRYKQVSLYNNVLLTVTLLLLEYCKGNGKGKVHPKTGHEGPEWEQTYSPILPSTSVLDGGEWSTPRPGLFIPGKDPVPIV
jgi:hypothetical protein